MSGLKKYVKTFYISIAAITLLVLMVFVFMSLIGDYLLIKESSLKKIYFADNMSPGHWLAVKRFNNLHKGKIEVVPIDLPFEKFSTNERKELLIRYLRSKSDRVDVFSVDQIWVPRFAKFVEPLGNYFPSYQREQFIDPAFESCFFKDQLVAIPLYFDISVMYYRIASLKQLPDYQQIKKDLDNFTTWEKFIELGERLKKFDKPFYVFPADDYEGLMCSYVELLESQNESMFKGDSVVLTTPKSIKALNLLVDLVNKYKLSPQNVVDYKETESDLHFLNEEGTFLRNWPGFYRWYETFLNRKVPPNTYERAPLPHFKGSKPASIIGGWNLMVSDYSNHKPEALEFIRYLVSEEAQTILFDASGYLPITKNFYNEEKYLNKYPDLTFYSKIIETAVKRPYLELYTRYSDVIAHFLNLAIKNEMSPEEALHKAEQVINSGDIFIK